MGESYRPSSNFEEAIPPVGVLHKDPKTVVKGADKNNNIASPKDLTARILNAGKPNLDGLPIVLGTFGKGMTIGILGIAVGSALAYTINAPDLTKALKDITTADKNGIVVTFVLGHYGGTDAARDFVVPIHLALDNPGIAENGTPKVLGKDGTGKTITLYGKALVETKATIGNLGFATTEDPEGDTSGR